MELLTQNYTEQETENDGVVETAWAIFELQSADLVGV